MSEIILSTMPEIPGKKITKHLGIVQGNTVRAKHIGRDLMAGLKNLVGGELEGYTELLSESRAQSIERMEKQARKLGANAIVNIRMTSSAIADGTSELFVYGTAVYIE